MNPSEVLRRAKEILRIDQVSMAIHFGANGDKKTEDEAWRLYYIAMNAPDSQGRPRQRFTEKQDFYDAIDRAIALAEEKEDETEL